MRILQINASYKPAFIYGGPTMSVSELSEQLVKAGVTLQVYTTTANGTVELEKKFRSSVLVDGVLVSYFSRITKDHTHFSPSLLRSVWKNVRGFDVVHIHAWWNLVSILSCLIAIIRDVPVILSPRGTLSGYSFQNRNNKIKSFLHQFIGIPLLKKSFIHTTSENESARIKSNFQTKSVYNLPNFIRLEKMSPLANRQTGDFLKLIFISRIEEKKGLDILIMALKNLPMPYLLTVAGAGSSKYVNYLKKLAADHMVGDNINWIGFQNTSKFKLLQQHDLLVLPSYDENFGNVVIESLSVGTAVLISDKVGLSDYVIHNQFGWVCKTNPNSIRDQILKVFQDDERLKLIRRIAPDKIVADFDEEGLVKQYMEMYTQIITIN